MVSIIIVNYHVKKELFVCLQSIIKSSPKTAYEIIVVDNDEEKTIEKDLKKKFPKTIYIPNINQGFGQGNNTGVKHAKGNYLFFLNPDTKIIGKSLDLLVTFLNKNDEVGIAAPLLYDDNNTLYPQGANELTPISAIFAFSFIHKIFPNNSISRKYWMADQWDKKTTKEVGSIPGAAFIIRREIFKKINGFDEKFFMYFEEHDLCRRVRTLGWKIIMYPPAKVYHALGRSSSQKANISDIFKKSRYYYFKKNYGLPSALLTESIMRLNKFIFMLTGILVLGAFLLLYRLSELMVFMGDQGWFYLSARDIVTSGTIPLVSIASSHPWLHQGPLWTYMLAGVMHIFSFNPLNGAYLSIAFGLLSIILIYFLGSKFFSQRAGIIAALLYAMSPMVIFHARMPYHTSPIPFFTLIYLFALYQWVRGNTWYLPVIIFTLAILYNFQIATFLLTIVFLIVAGYGLWRKKDWFSGSFTKRIIFSALVAFLVPMLPMLIYDTGHGFPQTLKFLAWIGYKAATLFGYPALNAETQSVDYKTVIFFLTEYYKRLVYIAGDIVAFSIAVFSFGFFYRDIIKSIQSKKHKPGMYLLGLATLVSTIGLIATKTVSEAYLPIIYPLVILITAFFFEKLMQLRPQLIPAIFVIIGLIAYMNVSTLLSENYLVGKGTGLADRIKDSKEIVTQSNGRSYNLVGKGEASQFESFTMNYEYLTWWLGNGPTHKTEALQYVISEDKNGVTINSIIKHD